MRASKQLEAFPPSDNAKRRQSSHRKAVVSVRLRGGLIARLDERVRKFNAQRPRKRVTRSDVIEQAIGLWLERGVS